MKEELLQMRALPYLALTLVAIYSFFLLYQTHNWAHYLYRSISEELRTAE